MMKKCPLVAMGAWVRPMLPGLRKLDPLLSTPSTLIRICDTVAVTGEVYLHQHNGLGRAEQAVHSVSCLYSTVKCKHLQLFVIQTGANSMWRIMSGFVISHGRLTPHKTTYGTGFAC